MEGLNSKNKNIKGADPLKVKNYSNFTISKYSERPGLESQRSRKRHFFHRKIFKFFKIFKLFI